MNSWKDIKETLLKGMTPQDRLEWEERVRATTERLTIEMDNLIRLDSKKSG